jgi:F-type H+-transporting ATPase subunit b
MAKRRRLDRGNASAKLAAAVLFGAIFIALGLTVFKSIDTTILQGIDFNLGKVFAQIGIVLIFVPIIYLLFGKPLQAAINERNSNLESTFKEAEDLRAEMTQLRQDYDRRLAETEAQAREQIQAQIKEAQALRDSLRSEAVQQAEELKRRALEEIESEKQHILADLRLHVVNLTLIATEKLVGQSVDSDTNRKLVEEFIDKVEVPT